MKDLKTVRVHIANSSDTTFDDLVYVDVKLHEVPRVGELVYIDYEQTEKLVKLAIKNESLTDYLPDWFYGRAYDIMRDIIKQSDIKPIKDGKLWTEDQKKEAIQKIDPDDFSFDDAIYCSSVGYFEGEECAHIELNDEFPKE